MVSQPLAFTARKYTDGGGSGHFEYRQVVEGTSFDFGVDVTCLNVYDDNRAKIGGVVRYSNDPTVPVGSFVWFQVFDNGEGGTATPDQSSLVGVRRRRRERGVLQWSEPAPLRAMGRPGERPGRGLAA